MQRKYLVPSLLVLAVASVPALADEIVYFTNGTSMPVESYSIEDGTIRLDLGDQAYVAFPVAQIDRIETTEGEVRNPDLQPANRMVGGGPTGSVPARYRRQSQGRNSGNRRSTGEAEVETRNGIAVYRPYANSPAANKRQTEPSRLSGTVSPTWCGRPCRAKTSHSRAVGGPIRGFAVTLSVGIVASVFTAVFVSRWIYDIVNSRRQRIESMSI